MRNPGKKATILCYVDCRQAYTAITTCHTDSGRLTFVRALVQPSSCGALNHLVVQYQ